MLLGWALVGALAAEPVRVTRTPYPTRRVPDAAVTWTCPVQLEIGSDGRPTSVAAAAGCPDWLVAGTERRVRRWRWEPADAGEARVDVVYRPPVETAPLASPLTWRHRDGGVCAVTLTVRPDGAVATSAAPDGCAVSVVAIQPPPAAPTRRRNPAWCDLTFLVGDHGATSIEAWRCPRGLVTTARRAVREATWVGEGVVTPWTVRLVVPRAEPLSR